MTNKTMPTARIIMDKLHFEKIMYWINQTNDEISGFGATKVENGVIKILEVWKSKDDVNKRSGASVEIPKQEASNMMYQAHKLGGDLNWHWHSHVNMNTGFSGTDMEQLQECGVHGLYIASVFNKRREATSAIACMHPVPFVLNNVQLDIAFEIPEELKLEWQAEYDRTTVERPAIQTYGGGYWRNGIYQYPKSPSDAAHDKAVVAEIEKRDAEWLKECERDYGMYERGLYGY